MFASDRRDPSSQAVRLSGRRRVCPRGVSPGLPAGLSPFENSPNLATRVARLIVVVPPAPRLRGGHPSLGPRTRATRPSNSIRSGRGWSRRPWSDVVRSPGFRNPAAIPADPRLEASRNCLPRRMPGVSQPLAALRTLEGRQPARFRSSVNVA